jgi:uncharacterized phage-associated protein
MNDSRAVANEFLRLAKLNKNDSLTPMQLLKLVFIAHGWSLGLLGRHLIRDPIEAWQYGPVIPALYASVRDFASNPVDGPLGGSQNVAFDDDELNIIEQVYNKYGSLSGPALSRLTHQPGTPWAKTYKEGSFGIRISNDLIEDYYQRLAAEDHQE